MESGSLRRDFNPESRFQSSCMGPQEESENGTRTTQRRRISFCKRSNFHVSWGDKLVPLIVIDCNVSLWKALFEDFCCANAIPPRREDTSMLNDW